MAILNTATFAATTARRLPDPNFKELYSMERHLLVVPVRSLPRGVPLDPNARKPKTSKRVYQKVRESLFNKDCEPGTFHLKNKGITIIAQKVTSKDNDQYEIAMLDGVHGIVDGGHTYTLITEAQGSEDLPEEQYVNVEVRVGVPDTWIPEIAGGLNTSVQVQDMSLDNLAGAFDWIQNELNNEPYFDQIAWSENDPGEFDARDLVALMTMFNVQLHPNDSDEHPVFAYEKKSRALSEYEKHMDAFKLMQGMLKDILRFHDIVRSEYYAIWNEGIDGGKAGNLAFSEKKRKGTWILPFAGKKTEYRMVNGALYPILAAFRWHVETDQLTGEIRWRDGFPAIISAWHDCALPLLKATHEMSNSLGRNPQSVGKSRPHWGNLHNLVAKRDLQRRANSN